MLQDGRDFGQGMDRVRLRIDFAAGDQCSQTLHDRHGALRVGADVAAQIDAYDGATLEQRQVEWNFWHLAAGEADHQKTSSR